MLHCLNRRRSSLRAIFVRFNMSAASSSSPHPNWKVGEKQASPYSEEPFVSLDPKDLASSYFLTISAVTPRPVAFVSTRSNAGTSNISPFSYFSAVAHDPPTVSVGICKNRDGSKKDTLVNIEENGEFVVNIISDWMVEAANHTCGAFPPDVDEFAVSGLTPISSDIVTPPRCAESAVQMECKLAYKHEIVNDSGEHTTTVVFGRVVRFHVVKPLLKDGPRGSSTPVVDTANLRPLGRLGGDTWVTLGDHFDIARPQV